MSTTYKILKGDTLALISKKNFGTEIHAQHIARANPGLGAVLIPGTNIVIPRLPNYPGDLPQILGISGQNDVTIEIDEKRFEFWTQLRIKRSIDSLDAISFTAPFEPNAPGYRETFRPYAYKPLRVYVGITPLLTGTAISMHPSSANNGDIITVSGYSLPGVLQDCTAPASSFPLEFSGITLKDIARAVAAPFGLTVDFADEPGDKFDQIAMKPTDRVFDFLADLARQRNLIISSTENGELRFWRSKPAGNPVATLEHGKSPVMSIDPNFNEQEYYSHITGISFVATGVPGAQYTDKNPYLPGTVRPFTFGASDTDNIDIKTAVNAKIGRMFTNAISYRVEVASWRDTGGALWQPNTTINIYAPPVFVYNKYNFILRSVEFLRDRDSESAILELVPPGGFEGKIPEVLPWGF